MYRDIETNEITEKHEQQRLHGYIESRKSSASLTSVGWYDKRDKPPLVKIDF